MENNLWDTLTELSIDDNVIEKLGVKEINALFIWLMSKYSKIIDYVDDHIYPDEKKINGYVSGLDYIGYNLKIPVYSTLVAALKQHIYTIHNFDEFYYQGLFRRYANELIPNVKIIQKVTDGKNIPDSWIEISEKLCPVECKKGSFDNKAFAQLKRYMATYKSDFGVAVAKDLKVELSDNIIFIPLSDLIKKAKQEDKQKEEAGLITKL